jgi:hypothetical protein
MTKAINKAIETLKTRDVSEYRKAKAAERATRAEYEAQCKMLGALGERPYKKLESHMKRALAPHRIEWKTYRQNAANDVNHDAWTTSANLDGEIWPAPKGGKYNMPMRAHISFNLAPHDGAEFQRMVAALKAAADAMTEAGL